MKSHFTGFVLAGGGSSRMGTDKFALELNGETFLRRAVDSLKTACAAVKIVLNRRQKLETEIPIVQDIYEARGALGGIHAALAGCATKFAVVRAVDLPFVSREAIENLTKLALEPGDFSAVVPCQTDGRRQPLCAVYRVDGCLPPLAKLLAVNETASVRDFLALIEHRLIDEKLLSADEDLLFNVNYPADYQKLN